MPTFRAYRHLFTVAEGGSRGPLEFQSVACSDLLLPLVEELEDLVGSFRLPPAASDRRPSRQLLQMYDQEYYAFTEVTPLEEDPHGRRGNYWAETFVVPRGWLQEGGWDLAAALEALPWRDAPELGRYSGWPCSLGDGEAIAPLEPGPLSRIAALRDVVPEAQFLDLFAAVLEATTQRRLPVSLVAPKGAMRSDVTVESLVALLPLLVPPGLREFHERERRRTFQLRNWTLPGASPRVDFAGLPASALDTVAGAEGFWVDLDGKRRSPRPRSAAGAEYLRWLEEVVEDEDWERLAAAYRAAATPEAAAALIASGPRRPVLPGPAVPRMPSADDGDDDAPAGALTRQQQEWLAREALDAALGDHQRRLREELDRLAEGMQRATANALGSLDALAGERSDELIAHRTATEKGIAEAAADALLRMTEALEGQRGALVEQIAAEAQRAREALAAELESAQEALAAESRSAYEAVAQQASQAREGLIAREKEEREALFKQVADEREAFLSELVEKEGAFASKLDEAREAFVARAEKAESAIASRAESAQDALADKVEGLLAKVGTKVDRSWKDLREQIERVQASLSNQIGGAKKLVASEVVKARAEMVQPITAVREEASRLKQELSALAGQHQEHLEAVDRAAYSAHQAIATANEAIAAARRDVLDSLTATIDEVGEQAREVAARAVASLGEATAERLAADVQKQIERSLELAISRIEAAAAAASAGTPPQAVPAATAPAAHPATLPRTPTATSVAPAGGSGRARDVGAATVVSASSTLWGRFANRHTFGTDSRWSAAVVATLGLAVVLIPAFFFRSREPAPVAEPSVSPTPTPAVQRGADLTAAVREPGMAPRLLVAGAGSRASDAAAALYLDLEMDGRGGLQLTDATRAALVQHSMQIAVDGAFGGTSKGLFNPLLAAKHACCNKLKADGDRQSCYLRFELWAGREAACAGKSLQGEGFDFDSASQLLQLARGARIAAGEHAVGQQLAALDLAASADADRWRLASSVAPAAIDDREATLLVRLAVTLAKNADWTENEKQLDDAQRRAVAKFLEKLPAPPARPAGGADGP